MTAHLVQGTNAMDAWLKCGRHLLGQPGAEQNNLVVEIESPGHWETDWFKRINPRAVHIRGEDPNDVANTIFPASTWRKSATRGELYHRYARAHARGKRKSWGTYFLRLIDFGTSHVNQLERAIHVLNSWENEPGTAIVFHLTSPETDAPRPLGGPCLQLCQLQSWNGSIDLTAVYRNHDYFNKALPNFIGLGRLQQFICGESGRQPGRLVCVSGHAYCSRGKRAMTDLIARA